MSNSSEFVEYGIDIAATQPISGAEISIQFTVNQTTSFGDADAGTLFAALLAAVPSTWTPILSSMNKLDQSMTTSNWSASAQAFQ